MTGISATGAADTTRQTNAASQDPFNELGQDAFLKLMVAQLKNQDPTQPMDSSQFLAQLAQFGTVSGVQGLQSAFNDLTTSLRSTQALQATDLLGRQVLVPGEAAHLPKSGSLAGVVEVPVASDGVTVGVYAASGELVRRMELGPQATGRTAFEWDGKNDDGKRLPPGEYAVVAQGVIGGEPMGLKTLLEETVAGVQLDAPGLPPRLELAGGGSIRLDAVEQIR